MATMSLGEIGEILGANHRNLAATAKRFRPSPGIYRLLLNEVDPNWETRPPSAFVVELLLQPNYLVVLPAWLSFNPRFEIGDELINTIIDRDDPKVVRLLTDYQIRRDVTESTMRVPNLGLLTIHQVLRNYLRRFSSLEWERNVNTLHIDPYSQLSAYYGAEPSISDVQLEFARKIAQEQPKFAPLFRSHIQAMETYGMIVNYEESTYNVRESYYIGMLLAAHSLIPKAERSLHGASDMTRLAAVVYTFLLDYVKEDESKLLLLGYAIQSVSPLYYSWWIEKFGLPTAQYLRKEVPEALTEYDFGVWARVYQPEIEAATVLLAKRAD